MPLGEAYVASGGIYRRLGTGFVVTAPPSTVNAPIFVSNNITSMTMPQAMSFAIPVGGLPMPVGTTWRTRVDSAPNSDLDPNTLGLRAKFLAMRVANYGEVALNIEKYNIVFHNLIGRGLPVKDVVFNRDYTYTPDTMYREDLGAHFRGMPYDVRNKPAIGTDRSMAVLSDSPIAGGRAQLHEFWQTYLDTEVGYTDNNQAYFVPNRPLPPDRLDGPPNGITAVPAAGYWTAMEGGRQKDTFTADVSGAFPQAKGSAATGLPNSYGCVAMWEADQIINGFTHPTDPSQNVVATPAAGPVRADTGLRANGDPVIGHALNCAITDAKAGMFSWPAQRSDGGDTSVDAIMEGQRIRLDPSITSAQLAARTNPSDGKPITPLGKAIAETLKRYGFIITDRTYSSIVMTTEGSAFVKSMTGVDPWGTFNVAGGYTNGVGGFEILRGMPWDQLQFLKKDWGKPV